MRRFSWGQRVAGTAVCQGWDMRVNIIFSGTPFPSLLTAVCINVWRKWFKPNNYVTVRNAFNKRIWTWVESFTSPQSLCKNTPEMKFNSLWHAWLQRELNSVFLWRDRKRQANYYSSVTFMHHETYKAKRLWTTLLLEVMSRVRQPL